MKKPESCEELNPGCSHLFIPGHKQGSPEKVKMIICQYLNVPLYFEVNRISDIQDIITRVVPDWECPYWQEGRKNGIYDSIQKTVGS